MTGRHTDQSSVLSKMFGDPESTWYQDILTNTAFSATQASFNSTVVDLHAIATDYKSQRAYIFNPTNSSIKYINVSLDGSNKTTTLFRLSIPVSRKVGVFSILHVFAFPFRSPPLTNRRFSFTSLLS
jgi:hypothetical protein